MKTELLFVIPLLVSVLLVASPNSFAEQVPFADVPFDTANIPEPVPPPAAVRDFFQLDPYYQQWINIRGFPVFASAEVSPYALKEAAWVLYQMIGHRPDVLTVMAARTVRLVIVPHNKHTSDMPESDTGRVGFFWELRRRGVYCRTRCPISSKTEEQLLGTAGTGSSPIHGFGHLFQDWGLNWIDPTFDNRVRALYNMAIAEGLYQDRYAGTNDSEYWAEGVDAWFDDADPNQHVAPTRSALKKYDPRLARLLTEVFGDGDWRYTRPATRTHLPHLQGFNPEEAPVYQRPARLLELERQLEDPDSDGDGKWVNLKLHDPSELPRLLNAAPRENRHRTETDLIFVNRTGTHISVYFFDANGKRNLRQRVGSDNTHLITWVGAVWLIEDHTGKNIAVFRAEEQVGRVLIGGPPSQDTLDVNTDGIVDLLDLTLIASRYGHRGTNPADLNKDGIVNIVDILLVAGSVSSLPRQAVETFDAAEVQKWLTDANRLGIEGEHQEKGIGVLEHLLTEIEVPSKSTEVATGPLRTIFEGHREIVWSVAFSPDGQTLVSGSWDRTVRLWNLHTQQLETTLIAHTEEVMSVTFSPDGETLASAGWDKTILFWNVRTGELIGKIKAHSDGIEAVVFSPDGETLASASADQTIRLWNVRTRQLERTLTGRARIRSIAFSPNGRTLASGSDGAVRLWDPRTGDLQSTLTEQAGRVNAVAFSPDGTILASGSGGGDNTIRLWDAKTGRHIRSITEHRDDVASVAFSPDSQTLASGSWNRTIRLWDSRTGRHKKTLTVDAGVIAMVFSPDGTRLAGGSNDNKVRLWEFRKDGEATKPSQLKVDVNGDGVVNVQDLVWVASNFGQSGPNDADVNKDGIVNITDLVLVAGALGDTAAAPTISAASTELFTTQEVRQWLIEAKLSGDNSPVYRRGILMLERLLMVLIPKETALLPNYPNPFNPETWIPYQLAKAEDVTLTLYAVDGTVVRQLVLGHQPIGIYQGKNRAAYWDGKNALGEPVASGLYFYTLTAGDFTATRRMLIMK